MWGVDMKRRIIKQGHSTHTITLPARWIKKYGFKAGDEIIIEGGKMGTYYRHVFGEIFHKNKPCLETPDIGTIKEGFVVTVKVDRPVKRGNKIFIYF